MMAARAPETAPWAFSPECPKCGGPGIPREAHHAAATLPGSARIACAACGECWHGSIENYVNAREANDLWDVRHAEVRSKFEERKRKDRTEKYNRAMRGEW